MLLKNRLFHKIRYTCFLIGFIFFIPLLKGAPVDSLTAKTAAANFYTRNYNVKSPSASLVYTEKSPEGEAEYYIYNMYPDSGFVIISADDAAHPIIGYSSEGYYNPGIRPPEFVFWMQHYKKQIAYIRLHNISATPDIQNEWNAYKNNLPFKSSKSVAGSVAPLVNTLWAQAPYFNANCPITVVDGKDSNDVAGCIATAMGQIMKYWAYPPHGLGASSYNDSPYGTLAANYDTTHYDWSAMPLDVIKSNAPIAALMYDCGVSVNMLYTLDNSGSFMIRGDAPICSQTAFVNYFGYNPSSIQGLYMSGYSYNDWVSLLENELNNKRPFLYAGSGDQGSHAWVCDGYNTNGDFHMNWGWTGNQDGYYSLTAMNPAGIPLNEGQEALIGIEPAPAVADFSANPVIVWAGDTVRFTDNSFGPVPITAWQWSFSGASNTSSVLQNPMAIYSTPGTYNVSETVTSSQGSGTSTHQNYIIVLNNNTVNVYPTLNNGTFTVQLHDASLATSNIEFSLYNIVGQKVYTTTLTQYITPLTVSVPHGMYFFRAFDASGKPVSTGKLMMK